MMEKYKSFNFPENSKKKQLFEKALQLCLDMKSLSNNPQIAPQDALKEALASGVTAEAIARIPNNERNIGIGEKTND